MSEPTTRAGATPEQAGSGSRAAWAVRRPVPRAVLGNMPRRSVRHQLSSGGRRAPTAGQPRSTAWRVENGTREVSGRGGRFARQSADAWRLGANDGGKEP